MAFLRRLAIDRALLLAGLGGGVDLLDQLDLRLLEEGVQLLDVALVELDLGQGGGDLRVREHAGLLALGHQALYLFELLEFGYGHGSSQA